jgi:hypothetical protein
MRPVLVMFTTLWTTVSAEGDKFGQVPVAREGVWKTITCPTWMLL